MSSIRIAGNSKLILSNYFLNVLDSVKITAALFLNSADRLIGLIIVIIFVQKYETVRCNFIITCALFVVLIKHMHQ